MSGSAVARHPIGASYQHNRTTHIRVWAPAARHVAVVVNGNKTCALKSETKGYFAGSVEAGPGDRYQFRLNGDDRLYPDPASRFQPDGPHGASQIVDSEAFAWADRAWSGATLRGQV